MRDLAEGIGGKLDLHSRSNVGTTVNLQVPLDQH
jgi:nitrate/nitrite-specific signal transduction histidine kinase